jgi:hypothetical protein
MSISRNKLANRISSVISNQTPSFIQEHHPVFLEFLKKYYLFLESSIITLSGNNDFILEEKYLAPEHIINEDNNFILLETSSKDFVVNENIVGSQSGAVAKILVNDFNRNKVLYITTDNSFIIGETVVGSISNSSSTIVDYKPNPLSSIFNYENYYDVDFTLDILFDEIKKDYFKNYPNFAELGIDEKLVIKKIKEINSLKGTTEANKVFFNAFFNTTAETDFPNQKILKCSDGQWEYDTIMRIITSDSSRFSNCIGQKIYSVDSFGNEISSAYISSVVNLIRSNNIVTEIKLEKYKIVGDFEQSSQVFCIDPVNDALLTGEIKNIVKNVNIENKGSSYTLDDYFQIENIGLDEATASIFNIGFGKVDQAIIVEGGKDYEIGDELSFDETYTNGSGAEGRVLIVGGSIILEDSTEYSPNKLLLAGSDEVIIEPFTFTNLGVPDEAGEITKVLLSNKGNGYTSLPIITVGTVDNPTNGTGAKIIAASINEPRIGEIQNVKVINHGLDFSSVPSVTLYKKFLIKIIAGNVLSNDTLTSHTGTIVSYNSSLNLLTLNSDDTFNVGDIITTNSGAQLYIYVDNSASITSALGSVAQTSGKFISERSKISSDYVKIQDSYFYQDFSYQIKTSESINNWRNLLKLTIHPSGWNVFGAVVLEEFVSNSISDKILLKSTFSPIILGKVFGRRLGTVYQGILNTDPNLGRNTPTQLRYDFILSESGENIVYEDFGKILFEKPKRELTLHSHVQINPYNTPKLYTKRKPNSLANLPIYAFSIPQINDTERLSKNARTMFRTVSGSSVVDGDYYTINQFSNYRIVDVSDYFYIIMDDEEFVTLEDGSGYIQSDYDIIPDSAYSTSVNVPPPAEISLIS